MKKFIKYILLLLVAVGAISAFFYAPDHPVEELKAKYAYPESQFIDIEGLTVHYRDTGPKDRPVLLLLHGVASSLHTWEGWQAALSNDFRVISIDVPSFGLTGPFPDNGALNTAKYMRFIDAFTKALNIDQFSIAGNSFGGYLAWNYVIHAPSRVEKLVLLNSGGLSKDIGRDSAAWNNNLGFFLTRDQYAQYLSRVITPRFLVFNSSAAMYGDPSLIKPEVQQRYYDLLRREGVRKAFSSVLQMSDLQKNNADTVAQIKTPTLILWGSEDKVLIPAEGQLFNQKIANSKYIEYKEVGHLPMEEIPEQSAKDAKAFLLNDVSVTHNKPVVADK
jgi:pimeloyl-ACP methyl ester carboxylesterase